MLQLPGSLEREFIGGAGIALPIFPQCTSCLPGLWSDAVTQSECTKCGIYGETTISETEELLEEGIDILPVPGLNKLDS
jgi:hypothetical protein